MRLRLLPGLFLLRRLVRELSGIRVQLTRQTDLLLRLTEGLAPRPPVVDREAIARTTGVDYVDPIDQALILAYATRCEQETGHPPTDDEIFSYLADEKTRDLHTRLIERDRDQARLAEERGR